MPTPYSDIYDLYSGMFTDYKFLQLPLQTQDEILEGWLLNAVSEFDNCLEDLSDRNDELKQFNITLSDMAKKVLVKYILVEWMNPKLYTLEYLEMHLTPKDFSNNSPANMLKEIRETHAKAEKKANAEKMKYAYKNFDPSKLKRN